MRILAIDCADKAVSCAVVDDGKILAENFASVGFTHSRTLMPLINAMLEISEISLDTVDLYAVTAGPGSFTGLRIGISAVKGLAFKKDTPCVAVSTLHAIAAGAENCQGIICAVMDARCQQVYNAVFECDGTVLRRLCDDRALMCDELKAELDRLYAGRKIYVVGPGTEMFCSQYCEADFIKPAARVKYQRAGDVALIAHEYTPVKSEELLPVYLRLPQAERELKERKK